MKRISVLLLVLSMSLELLAARVTVDMRLDSASMLIGHQNRCYVEVCAAMDAEVNIPVYLQDTIVTGLMILQRSPIDSVDIDNGRKRISVEYLLTSFDAGVYFIPPLTVEIDGQDYESNYLTLKVNTYEVDTASMQMFDIKPVEKAPFVLSDFTELPLRIWGLIALIILVIALIITFRRTDAEVPYIAPEELLPPHVIALSALDEIKEQKLWQQGQYKEFYTQLTDVLRSYMARRFDFPAMEMTTWEILSMLKQVPEAAELYLAMKQMLELSDFVKFAKMNPLPEDNQRSLRDAYEFVESTREREQEPAPDQSENTNETQS